MVLVWAYNTRAAAPASPSAGRRVHEKASLQASCPFLLSDSEPLPLISTSEEKKQALDLTLLPSSAYG